MPLRFIAVALDKTDLHVARFTLDGVQEARVKLYIAPYDDAEIGLRRIRSAIRQVWPLQDRITAVGLSLPGLVDYKRGRLRSLSGFPGWIDVPLCDHLVEAFGAPVFIAKAADAAALGEQRFGVGQGISDLIYLALQEKLECGTIYQNRLLTGGNGLGGEIGYLIAAHPGASPLEMPPIEAWLSRQAFLQRAQKRMVEDGLASPADEESLTTPSVEAVCLAAQQGTAWARAVLEETAGYLAAVLLSLMYLFDPTLFVLDGLARLAGEALLAPLRKNIAAHAPAVYRERTRIILAQLGNDVTLWGALALCLAELGL